MEYNIYTLQQLATIKYGKNQKKVVADNGHIPIYGTGGLMGYATQALYDKPSVLIGRKGTIDKVKYITQPFWTVDTLFYTEINETIVLPHYLYYALSLLDLKQYNEGTTIPSLRTETLNRLEFKIPKLQKQKEILSILEPIEKKIELNNKINENLQNQAFAIFDTVISNSQSEKCMLFEIAELNPKRTIVKNTEARCIDMSQLSTSGSFPSGWETKPFNGGMRFQNGDTLLARITPCLENGKTAFIDFLEDNEIAFGSTEYIVMCSKSEYPPQFFYCLARHPKFVDYAVKNMNGSSGRQRVSADVIGKYGIPKLTERELQEFNEVVPQMFEVMRNNSLENISLTQLRDTVLPKLMSGELDISELNI